MRQRPKFKLKKQMLQAWAKNPNLSGTELAKMFNFHTSTVGYYQTKYLKLSKEERIQALKD